MPVYHAVTLGRGIALLTPSADAVGRMASDGAGTLRIIKDNLSAAVDPTVNDDTTSGYEVGSRWINTTDDEEFVCVDATDTAAVWVETTAAGGGGGLTIGDAITSGTANRLLFEDGSNQLAESANLLFGETNTGLHVKAAAATTVPLRATGATSQSANMLELNSVAGGSGDLFRVSPTEVQFPGQMLSGGHGTVSLPAYSFNIGGNKAYGMWYGGGAIHFSINGAEVGKYKSNGLSLAQSTSANKLLTGFSRELLNRASSVAENAESQGSVITNSGAGAGTTSTLPSAVAGYHQFFADNNASFRLTVVPNTGDQLIWTDGTVVTAATGSVVATARYDSFYAVAVDTTTWVAMHSTGTWTVTP